MNNNNFAETIKNIYEQETYLDKHGDSVLFTIFIVIIFFVLFSYFVVKTNIKSLKGNWNENKCKPYVIPFAGLINNDPKKSNLEFTGENFTECTYSILNYIISEVLQPIYYSVNNFHTMFENMEKSIENSRKMFSYIRNVLSSIVTIIMTRILNVMMPLQHSFIKVKSIFGKINGILTTSLFTAIGSFLTLKSFFRSFTEILIIALGSLAAAIGTMWILPFTWPAAAAATAFFLAVSIPLAAILAGLERVVYLTEKSLPKKPRCFDENTLIPTENGDIKIKHVKPGTILKDGNTITATLKLDAKQQNMYKLNEIIVSGSHLLVYNNKIIYVHEHPDSLKIESYDKPYIYCISTKFKTISLNNTILLDWDDITAKEAKKIIKSNITCYENLYGGFPENTSVILNNGEEIVIEKVKIGDVLKNNNIVYGVVSLPSTVPRKYFIENNEINCGKHLYTIENNLAKSINEYQSLSYTYEKIPMYHLLTSKSEILINKTKFCDFNGCIDLFLEKH